MMLPSHAPSLAAADEELALSTLRTVATTESLVTDRDAFLAHMAELTKSLLEGGSAPQQEATPREVELPWEYSGGLNPQPRIRFSDPRIAPAPRLATGVLERPLLAAVALCVTLQWSCAACATQRAVCRVGTTNWPDICGSNRDARMLCHSPAANFFGMQNAAAS